MIISQLQLNNFRCFNKKMVDFSAPITLIQGDNGSGKTSILEALYYLCHLRSFRASNSRDLISLGNHEFFLKAHIYDQQEIGIYHDLHVGYAGDKKLVKLGQRTIISYKELMDHYRVVALFEDDVELIKDGPDARRIFVDQALLLLYPELLNTFREFKLILDNRNALLKKYQGCTQLDFASYYIWTEQLWQASKNLAEKRRDLLTRFEHQINRLLCKFFEEKITVLLKYQSKKEILESSWDEFKKTLEVLAPQELRFGRSLLGAHLDDFLINYTDKQTRFYVSRGQQKLTVLLLKVVLLMELQERRGKALFLLDDFMTDFDEQKIEIVVNLLSGLGTQLIFTSPAQHAYSDKILISLGANQLKLT